MNMMSQGLPLTNLRVTKNSAILRLKPLSFIATLNMNMNATKTVMPWPKHSLSATVPVQ